MLTKLKKIGLVTGLSATLLLAACGNNDANINNNDAANNNAGGGDVGEEVNYTITGIEPGAGVVQAAENSVDEYDLDGWEVDTSSSGAMAAALGEAIENEEPIIVTG